MSALPPRHTAALRISEAEALAPLDALVLRWEVLHASAAHLAELAGLSPEASSTARAALPVLFAEASAWQRDIAARGIEDMDTMMHIGMTALAAVRERGSDPLAPALALWRAFHDAREAVLAALLPYTIAA